jgi:hypothetical protein
MYQTRTRGRISMIISDLNILETVNAENVIGGCGKNYRYDEKPKYQPTKYDKKPKYYEPTKSYDPCETVCYEKCDEKGKKEDNGVLYVTICKDEGYKV